MNKAKTMRRGGVPFADIRAKLREKSAAEVARAKKDAAVSIDAAQARHVAVLGVCDAMDKVFNGVMTLDLVGSE